MSKPIHFIIFPSIIGLLLLTGKLVAQTITYNTPQVLSTGTAVTLTPTTSGLASLSAYAAGTSLTTTNIRGAFGLAADAAGAVYVCNFSSTTVYKYANGAGAGTSFITGLSTPSGIVFDSAGNCYVISSAGVIKEYTSTGGASPITTITLTGTIGTTYGFAIDASDNLYITNYSATGPTNQVIKYNTSASTQTTLISGGSLSQPEGVAVDASNNLYVLNSSGTVIKYDASGTAITNPFSTGLTTPYGITIDKGGYIYISDYLASGTLKVYNPAGSAVVATITGLAFTDGLTVDTKGNLYTANYVSGAGSVHKYIPHGGYFIDKQLPAGLNFDGTTGIISGIPTTVNAATYTITAYNSSGTAATGTISITTINPPSISYSPATQTYPLNQAISTYSPTSSGGAIASFTAYSTGTQLTGATLSSPWGMAVDTAGYIYVANSAGGTAGSGTVSKYNPDGSYSSVFVSGLTNPVGLVFDSSNNCFILCEANTSKVFKYTAGGSQLSTNYILGLNQSYGIAIDKADNLYFTDITGTTYTVKKFNSGGTSQALTALSALNIPYAITLDPSGNIYVLNKGNGRIYQYAATGGAGTAWLTGLTTPYGLTSDALGNIYVANTGNSTIEVYDSGNNLLATISGATTPRGITVDRYGNLYASSFTGTKVTKYVPNGGYFLNKALPTGLSFDSTTGNITGTPTAVTAMTTYTITAYSTSNAGGSSTALINIATQLLAPNISYTTPVSYFVSAVITSPTLTNTGSPVVTTVGYSSTATQPFGATFNNPARMAVDASGNIYIANFSGNNIVKYASDGTTLITTSYGTGAPALVNPMGIVFDSAGNCYVLNANATIYKYNSTGAYQSTITVTGAGTTYGLAIDASDLLYITSYGTSTKVYRYTTAGVGGSIITAGLNVPVDVDIDAAGNIFVLNQGNNTIEKYTTAFVASSFKTGLSTSHGRKNFSSDFFVLGHYCILI